MSSLPAVFLFCLPLALSGANAAPDANKTAPEMRIEDRPRDSRLCAIPLLTFRASKEALSAFPIPKIQGPPPESMPIQVIVPAPSCDREDQATKQARSARKRR